MSLTTLRLVLTHRFEKAGSAAESWVEMMRKGKNFKSHHSVAVVLLGDSQSQVMEASQKCFRCIENTLRIRAVTSNTQMGHSRARSV